MHDDAYWKDRIPNNDKEEYTSTSGGGRKIININDIAVDIDWGDLNRPSKREKRLWNYILLSNSYPNSFVLSIMPLTLSLKFCIFIFRYF